MGREATRPGPVRKAEGVPASSAAAPRGVELLLHVVDTPGAELVRAALATAAADAVPQVVMGLLVVTSAALAVGGCCETPLWGRRSCVSAVCLRPSGAARNGALPVLWKAQKGVTNQVTRREERRDGCLAC